MKALLRAALLTTIIAVASCASEPRSPTKPTCSPIGQRLGETPVKGFIFGSIGTKVLLAACPDIQVPIAFLGDEPLEYSRLKEVAAQRVDVVGFDAVADGFVVQERDGDPVLILITLAKLREDPDVAEAAQTAAPR